MIWLTWRQHRKQALVGLIGLAVLAAVIIPTGLAMRHTFDKLGLPACVRSIGTAKFVSESFSNACNDALQHFNSQYTLLATLGVLFVFVPLVVGLFFGAPLVAREIEHGTHRLVWTQGVSRRHWAIVKFGLVGAGAVAAAVVYGLGLSWWLAPLSRAGNSQFRPFTFDVHGVAPVGYTLFAVALGIFAGTFWHKVLPAMAVTLAGFIGVRALVAILARPRYLPALTYSFAAKGPSPQRNPMLGDWVQATAVRDASGEVLISGAQVGCLPHEGPCAFADAVNWERYQPGSRFWVFQGIETGIFVALAALLVVIAVQRLRRIA